MIAVHCDTYNNNNSDKISIVTLWYSTYNLPPLDSFTLRKVSVLQVSVSQWAIETNKETVKIKGWLVHWVVRLGRITSVWRRDLEALLAQKDLGSSPWTEIHVGFRGLVEALVLDCNYGVFTTDGTAASQTTIHIAQWEMHRICSITVIFTRTWFGIHVAGEGWHVRSWLLRRPLPRVHFGNKKKVECSVFCRQPGREGGGWGQHTSMNSNMTVDVALVTLIPNTSDVPLCCSVEVTTEVLLLRWKVKQQCHVVLKHPPSTRLESSYKWNGSAPESKHVKGDHEHRASRAAAPGPAIVSNDSSLTIKSWPSAASEYIIHYYRCVLYNIDKATDTLKTHHKHKHTKCIALKCETCLRHGWTTKWSFSPDCFFFFSFPKQKFSLKLTWDRKNTHED